MDFWEILKRDKQLDYNKDEWDFEPSIINILMNRRFKEVSNYFTYYKKVCDITSINHNTDNFKPKESNILLYKKERVLTVRENKWVCQLKDINASFLFFFGFLGNFERDKQLDYNKDEWVFQTSIITRMNGLHQKLFFFLDFWEILKRDKQLDYNKDE